MALFKKDTKKEEGMKTAAPQVRTHRAVLVSPRITEKATGTALSSVYVFDVATTATKREIIASVAELYKVVPRKVAIVTVPTKKVRSARTGVQGKKGGGKKAYVYLKQGETISIH